MKSATILKWLTLQTLLALSVSPAFAGTKTAMPLTADAVNSPASPETVNAKASPAAILRAQIMLDRAHFSPGEIDGAFGTNMQMAISAYQRNRKLEVTGIVDENTWASLNQDDLPALSTYTIDAADVAGPFVKIPASIAEQARLKSLAYVSPVEALSEKFHANPRLLILLNVGKNFDKAGEEILVPNVLSPEPLPAAAKVVVDRSDASVSLLDSAGNVIARYPASTGSKHDPLPVGEWVIKGVALNPVFHYNPELFWDADPKSEKAKIAAGPNNPVGTAWIDLSKEHYGIHGTPDPSKIGKTESHGCIRLSNWNVTELAAAISPDMPALLQE